MAERKLLESGSRFMTAPSPQGMGLKFYDEEGVILAPVVLDERHEGPPQCVHGGFSAALIDEAMGTAVWRAGYQVVAANIQFNLRLPVPLHQEVTVRAWVEKVDGRKVYTKGEIRLGDDRVAVEGQGLFIEAPHLFKEEPHFTRIFKTADEE